MNRRATRRTKIVVLICMFIIGLFFVINCDDKGSEGNTRSDEVQKAGGNNNAETTQKAVNEPRWVSADAGLKLRSGPGTDYDTLDVIPYAEKVQLLEEEQEAVAIGGVQGKWGKVRWNKNEGWVFGGFLTEEEIKALPANFTKQFIWGSKNGPYYSIWYPDEGWRRDKGEKCYIKSFCLCNDTACIQILGPPFGFEEDPPEMRTTDAFIGKARIPANKTELIRDGHTFFIGLAAKDNTLEKLGIRIWLNKTTSSELDYNLKVFEQIAANLEIITEEKAKNYLESLEIEEE
ncbi:MAG: SH3 domain-containing protein [Spirochaetales bacterium]|nr:SH3 domain-containing protein [Spirochaetales bacterium]